MQVISIHINRFFQPFWFVEYPHSVLSSFVLFGPFMLLSIKLLVWRVILVNERFPAR